MTTESIRIPNEPRFVRAIAQVVDPGDTLTFLLETGAFRGPDLTIVRRAHERASETKGWEQTHTIGVLRGVLGQPNSAAYVRSTASLAVRSTASLAVRSTASLAVAVVGCARDTGCLGGSLGAPRRPWAVEANDVSLPGWRDRVRTLPGKALPQPDLPALARHDLHQLADGEGTT